MPHASLFSNTLNLYQIENNWVSWNASNSEVASLSGIEAWMLFALDNAVSEKDIIQDLVLQGHNQVDLSKQLKKLQHSLALSSAPNGYQQEFEHIKPLSHDSTSVDKGSAQFQLLGKNIFIHSDDANLHSLITDLFRNHPVSSEHEAFVFSIQRQASLYKISCNQHLLASTENRSEVLPILMDHIQIISYQHSDYLLAIHAAMLKQGEKGIILAGASGSGKSTLCADLSNNGFTPYSDEIALVDKETLTLSPMVLPMAIKTGSWPTLQETFPKLVNYPEWKREDGRILKYIPLNFNNHELPSCKVRALVFPRFNQENSHPRLEKISTISALHEISTAGYQIKNYLDKTKFEALLEWLGSIPAYRIEYADSEAALQLVEQILHG